MLYSTQSEELIRKMSDDWHQIALIAAKGYNSIVDLRVQLKDREEKLAAVREAWEYRVCDNPECSLNHALGRILQGGE